MLPTTCPAPGAGASKHAYAAASNTVSATGLVCTDDCEKASVSLQQHNSGRRRSVIQARICLMDFLLLPIPTKRKLMKGLGLQAVRRASVTAISIAGYWQYSVSNSWLSSTFTDGMDHTGRW